jgi:hypothetical protein
VSYRGQKFLSFDTESRPRERVAWIKRFHETGQGLWSQLANCGNPYAVAQFGLLDAVTRHVGAPASFLRTHFLSFTSDEAVALRYARNPPPDEPDIDKASYPDDSWEHTHYVVFRLNISQRQLVEPGVYRLAYNQGAHQALLIDVPDYLTAMAPQSADAAPLQEARKNAARDREWLVLPAELIPDGTLSALLHKGSDLEAEHYVSSSFFTDRGSAFF